MAIEALRVYRSERQRHNQPLTTTMKVSDKLTLIDKIGRALQAKFTFTEIDAFLAEYKIRRPESEVERWDSKRAYSKEALQGVDTETLFKIAGDLNVEAPRGGLSVTSPPRNWKNTKQFRLFISHISKDTGAKPGEEADD